LRKQRKIFMKQKVKPVIFLGLGKYGSEIAKGVYTTILAETQKDLAKVISCITLEENGEYRDIKEDEIMFKYEGLNPTLSLGNFHHNFKIIQDHEKQIEDGLADKIENLRRREFIFELQDKGYEIEEKIELFLISTLFDTIGSSAIIPFLGFIQCLLAGRLRGMLIEINILGFFPDLFDEYKKEELSYCRSYTCLQELDFIADNPKLISSKELIPFSFAYLFTGKNEEAIEIGSYKELTPMITKVLFSLLTGEIASDVSFSTVFLNRVDGKATRYNSFGLNKLVFPIDRIMRGLSDYLGFAILNLTGATTPKIFDIELINVDVKEFLLQNKFDGNYKLSKELYLDAEGRTIWVDFKYKGNINENTVVENFINEMEDQVRDFDKDDVTGMNRKLSLRRDEFFKEKQERLLSIINSGIDTKDKGLYYSKAFLDVFLNQSSPYTTGNIVGKAFNFDQIERVIKNFFDKNIESKREILAELKQDIKGKSSFLKKLKRELKEKNMADRSSKQERKDSQIKTDLEDKKELPASTENIGGKSLEDRIKEIEIEIKPLEKKYSELKKEIENFDFKIADPSKRRKLLKNVMGKLEEEIEKTKTNLAKTDEEYWGKKQKLDELYDKQKRTITMLLIILFGGSVAFLFILYTVFNVSFLLGSGLYFLGAIGYGTWGFLKFLKDIRTDISTTFSRVNSLKTEKVNLLLNYQGFYNQIFRARFEHFLHGGLFEKVIEYKKFVRKKGDNLQSFIDNIVQSLKEKKEVWENITFSNSLFVRSVGIKDDLDRFIKENIRLPLETERFFKEKPLSKCFGEFREKGNLSSFFSELDIFSEEVFKPLREKSIDEFLKEGEEGGRINLEKKMVDFVNAGKTHIFLEVEKGMDCSLPLTYIGVENTETSYVKEILRKEGHKNIQLYSTRNKYEISVYRFKIGFPAFNIALIKYGKRLISKVTDINGLYINPEWEPEDLLPSVYFRLSNEVDEEMQIISLANAFGLIEEKEKEFYFKDTNIGKSYQATVDFIKSFKGSSIRNQLSNQIEKEKQKENARDRLFTYINSKDMDKDDKLIVERTLKKLNPLA